MTHGPPTRRRRADPPARWRVVSDPALPGARNMALDDALARCLEAGQGVLRLYRWDRPTLSFGRNEPARGLYDPEVAEELDVGLVRRPTGGRAVLHHQELTYAAVVEVGGLGGLRDTYRRINRALVAALEALGVPAALASGTGPTPGVAAGPCFDVPAEGEVVAGGRKLVGSAQVRIGRSILQHGSIILGGDQSVIARLGGPVPEPPATIEGFLGAQPERAALEDALVAAFREELGGEWCRTGTTPREEEAARELETRYRAHEWTWRR